MAKLSSSSCAPLLKGMMLLALLLLASIQAVQAQGLLGEIGEKVGAGVEEFGDRLVGKAPTTVTNTVLNGVEKRRPDWKPSIQGAKKGFKVYKYSCKALNQALNPGGASGSQYQLVLLNNDQPRVIFRGSICSKQSDEPQQAPAAGTGVPINSYPYPRNP